MSLLDYINEPGKFSIIVQGGVFEDNIVEVANICEHWRTVFPCAQIICAISSSDIIFFDDGDISAYESRDLDWRIKFSIDVLRRSCDSICFSGAALPLPPNVLMRDAPFNANLQLATAKEGLKLAVGDYVLRIRNDAYFFDDCFVDQYEKCLSIERGEYASLEDRVLIGSTFTINPYGMERYPFHYCDWFHFGRLSDVKALWDISPYPMRDINFYRHNPHAAWSRDIERNHIGRVTFEQHLIVESFKEIYPEISLKFHNDFSSRNLSVKILLDNFVVCDFVASKFVFEKYKETSSDQRVSYWSFMTHEDWKILASTRNISIPSYLYRPWGKTTYELGLPFPRCYRGKQLSSSIGVILNDEVVLSAFGEEKKGALVHGPYATLPRGSYRVDVDVSNVEHVHGEVILRVTLDQGGRLLVEKPYSAKNIDGNMAAEFSIDRDIGHNLEVVIDVRKGIYEMAIAQVVISRLDGPVFYQESAAVSQEVMASSPIISSSEYYSGTSIFQDNQPEVKRQFRGIMGSGAYSQGAPFELLPGYFKAVLKCYSLALNDRLKNKMLNKTRLYFEDAKSWDSVMLGKAYFYISRRVRS